MPITQAEAKQIVTRISPIFQQVLTEYDFRKYPAADYVRFQASFSALSVPNHDIEEALVWKWGHWGKTNYPQSHRDLIATIQGLWTVFVGSGFSITPARTFDWWRTSLNSTTSYITTAFITHLVHHSDPLPIFDQHNYRAMNFLICCLRQGVKPKKKPSTWADIVDLKSFMTLLHSAMPGKNFAEIDRFLMMYGRNYCPR